MGMGRFVYQRGIISLAVCLAVAGGLLLCPEEFREEWRGLVRSAIVPGTETLADLHETLRTSLPVLNVGSESFQPLHSPETSSTAAGTEQGQAVEAAVTRIRELEGLVASLQQRVMTAETQAALGVPVAGTQPMWEIAVVPATVLGKERGESERAAARLIQCGTRAGVARGDLVFEPVIDESLSADSRTILLDQGRGAAIDVDRPVACGRMLIGRVRAVGSLVSTVELCVDEKFRIGARLLRETPQGPVFGAVGVYAGTGTSVGRLELIATTETVREGDAVYTDADVVGTSVPLFIGRVRRAELEAGASHWTIDVVPAMQEVPQKVEVLTAQLNTERFSRKNPSNETEGPR